MTSIIYGKNLLNETIILSSHTHSDPNYEVLLPVIFIIVFIFVLFLIYAYNNLNLKYFLVERVFCCCRRGGNRRRRRYRYPTAAAVYDYNPNYLPPSMNPNYTHFPKSANQTSIVYAAANNQAASFKMSTFVGDGVGDDANHYQQQYQQQQPPQRNQNVYYTYRPRPTAVPQSMQLAQFYAAVRQQTTMHTNNYENMRYNYENVHFTPNYAYRLAAATGPSSSSENTTTSNNTSMSRYQLPNRHVSRFNPLFSSSENRTRRSLLAVHYSNSNAAAHVGLDESETMAGRFHSPMMALNMINDAAGAAATTTSSSSATTTSRNRRYESKYRLSTSTSSPSSFDNDDEKAVYRTSPVNTTPQSTIRIGGHGLGNDDNDYDDDVMIVMSSSWRTRQQMRQRRRLSDKLAARIKSLSRTSEGSLIKGLCRELRQAATVDFVASSASKHGSNYSLAGSANRQFRYSRLCKSHSFMTHTSNRLAPYRLDPAQAAAAAMPINQQQEILNLNADRFISEPQLTTNMYEDESVSVTNAGVCSSPIAKTQDACVQTSTTIYSDSSTTTTTTTATTATTTTTTSAINETLMQTNTMLGSILANLGSASVRPSSTAIHAPCSDDGVFEINRALMRHRAFSDGNGLSTRATYNNVPSSLPHSISSSKLLYKRF